MKSVLLDNLYTKTDKFITVEADEALYSANVIDTIEQYFYEMAVNYKTHMYWEGNMEYGCFSVSWIEGEQLFMGQFLIGPSAR